MWSKWTVNTITHVSVNYRDSKSIPDTSVRLSLGLSESKDSSRLYDPFFVSWFVVSLGNRQHGKETGLWTVKQKTYGNKPAITLSGYCKFTPTSNQATVRSLTRDPTPRPEIESES